MPYPECITMNTLSLNPEIRSSETTQCIHCEKKLKSSDINGFCCSGCETVYYWIQDRGLSQFYQLKKKGAAIRKSTPAALFSEKFDYLDDPAFRKAYSWPSQTNTGTQMMEFYLEGVHCAACVWVTEKLSDLVPHTQKVRLNLGNQIAKVEVDSSSGSFAQVAEEFFRLGYRPHPIKRGTNTGQKIQQKEDRFLLIQLGVAAACAGNIMLLAVSLYGGAAGSLANHFRWISFFLYLPVLGFSAAPFFKSAWSSLKNAQASIDIPVAFGLLIGSLISIIRVFQGSDQIYFDSLSSLILLLLSTRYFLKKTQRSALNSTHLLRFLIPSRVKKLNLKTGQFELKAIDEVCPGDEILIQAGEAIPVDGVITQGTSSVNHSFLTGESTAVPVTENTRVYAGAVNLQAPIHLKVTQSGGSTRLASILASMEEQIQKKAPIVSFSDQISKAFVFAVFALCTLTVLLGIHEDWQTLIQRILIISLVTCPCAFALATPLVMSLTLGKLAKAGILVKGSAAVEKLSQIKSVFLDKTGTLTYGHFKILAWNFKDTTVDRSYIRSAVYALESQSNHPIALALVDELRKDGIKTAYTVTHFKETLGQGVSGEINGDHFEISRTPHSIHGTEISILFNQKTVATLVLGDQIREDSLLFVNRLKRLGLLPRILSGDNQAAVHQVAEQLGIPPLNCFSEASPEQKCEIIRQEPQALMVGDGINDSIALAAAYVSIAVHQGVEVSLRSADIYLSTPSVSSIAPLIIICKETLKVIHRNFLLSLLYNCSVGYAAVTGNITPLFAAILMPLSAFILFLSSIAGTKKMRKNLGELIK
jgi:Cu2+-exporting ATPase/Cu+-exporting ATPase